MLLTPWIRNVRLRFTWKLMGFPCARLRQVFGVLCEIECIAYLRIQGSYTPFWKVLKREIMLYDHYCISWKLGGRPVSLYKCRSIVISFLKHFWVYCVTKICLIYWVKHSCTQLCSLVSSTYDTRVHSIAFIMIFYMLMWASTACVVTRSLPELIASPANSFPPLTN